MEITEPDRLDYPGAILRGIIENVLYYYTEPFEVVVDPMAGGGPKGAYG